MKKLLVLLVLVLTSCTLSKEEKAEKLFKETLYYPDSYVPLSTRVDSMFVDVTMIRPIMEISGEINDLMGKINECEYEISSAESSMDIYAPDGYSSQYSRRQYAQAEEEKNEAQSDLDRYTKKLSEQLLSLKKMLLNITRGHLPAGLCFIHLEPLMAQAKKPFLEKFSSFAMRSLQLVAVVTKQLSGRDLVIF